MQLSDLSLVIPVSTLTEIKPETVNLFTEVITYGLSQGPSSNFRHVSGSTLGDGQTIQGILTACKTPWALVLKEGAIPQITKTDLEALVAPLKADATYLTYSDYKQITDGKSSEMPLIDYQVGSVRDDFDFGPLWALNVSAARTALKNITNSPELKVGAWYGVRLRISAKKPPVRISKYLYEVKSPSKKLGYEDQFSYVDSKNRASQIELEAVCTEFAKEAGFFLPERKAPFASKGNFPVTASVVIPVRDRVKTVGDAVKSALTQKTNFKFNVIVVDNHSTDGTTQVLQDIAQSNPQLVHIIPSEGDLLIGGCWNKGINAPECGEFAVQLDSDDLYISDSVLQKVIDKFREEHSAAVVGSYNLVNFDLKDIPPGLIDHKEWTPENGHNNALRIHGLGAPRAIATALAREIKFENVSYGEDYAMMLAICRRFRLSRIYESLYLCRRWDGNSDANLPIEKKNKNNIYKDLIRSKELLERKELVKRELK